MKTQRELKQLYDEQQTPQGQARIKAQLAFIKEVQRKGITQDKVSVQVVQRMINARSGAVVYCMKDIER